MLVLAGCLEASPPPADPPAPRLMKAPQASLDIPAPERPPPVTEAFDSASELRAPVRDGRLALLPIVAEPAPSTSYITLRAGMASGEVIAIDVSTIEAISVTNRSDRPLLILGGELVVGGHQDRVTTRTTVIPAHKTQAVSTMCAELGRSDGPDRFRAAIALAEPTLRKLATGGGDQTAVWERIGALTGDWTNSYRLAAVTQRAGVNADRLRNLTAQLDAASRREERHKTVGFAVAIDDKVIAIEHFSNAQLFHDLRDTVIASYLPSSVGKRRDEGTVSAKDVRAFREKTGAGGPVPSRNLEAAPNAARPAAPSPGG